MSEQSYQPAPGITIRQRISVKQNAKLEFQRDYTVEITGSVRDFRHDPFDLWLGDGPEGGLGDGMPVSSLNEIALRRAEADWSTHVARVRAGDELT